MTPYEIPLTPEPQKLSLQLAGVSYGLRLQWNDPADCWMLDLLDSTGTLLVGAIPVVTGVDLLGQYGYLGIGGALIAQTDFAADAVPTLENLGVEGRLYFVVGA
jgi:hypothetical protein